MILRPATMPPESTGCLELTVMKTPLFWMVASKSGSQSPEEQKPQRALKTQLKVSQDSTILSTLSSIALSNRLFSFLRTLSQGQPSSKSLMPAHSPISMLDISINPLMFGGSFFRTMMAQSRAQPK